MNGAAAGEVGTTKLVQPAYIFISPTRLHAAGLSGTNGTVNRIGGDFKFYF